MGLQGQARRRGVNRDLSAIPNLNHAGERGLLCGKGRGCHHLRRGVGEFDAAFAIPARTRGSPGQGTKHGRDRHVTFRQVRGCHRVRHAGQGTGDEL